MKNYTFLSDMNDDQIVNMIMDLSEINEYIFCEAIINKCSMDVISMLAFKLRHKGLYEILKKRMSEDLLTLIKIGQVDPAETRNVIRISSGLNINCNTLNSTILSSDNLYVSVVLNGKTGKKIILNDNFKEGSMSGD